jgi:transcriptional regulator with XRE-family HTH domain
MKIGTKLRQLRDSHGFSQDYVADKLSMSQSNYSKLKAIKMKVFHGKYYLLLRTYTTLISLTY